MLKKVIEPSRSTVDCLSDDEQHMNDEQDNDDNITISNRMDTLLPSPSTTRQTFTTRLKNENTTIHVIGVCYFIVLQGRIKIMGRMIESSHQSYFLNASCQFGMIPIENCGKEQATIEFYIPDSIASDDQMKFDQFVRCFFIHRNMQIFNNQKLDKSKRKLKSLYIFSANDESVPSHPLKFSFADNFIKRVMNRATTSKNNRKYLIVGHGLSGKSVFSTYLMNVLLNDHPKVAFLDLNINVPSHGVRGTMSLSIHTSATFGPLYNSQNFEENELIDWCYHGHASTDIQMETYIHQSMNLYQLYKKKFKDIPLVVNTHSLLPSSGYQIVLELARLFSPIDIVILSNFKNPSYSPSPSGPLHHDALNNRLTFIQYNHHYTNENSTMTTALSSATENQFNGANTPIFDLRNLETLFILNSKQAYRNHYFSKINMQHFWYFSRYYSTQEFLHRFNPFLNTILEGNNTLATNSTTMNYSQSIYQFFSELTPCRKIKWNSLIITLLNMDPSELSQGLYHLNASFVGIYKFMTTHQNKQKNSFYSTLSQHHTKSDYPLMTLKTSTELDTQFIGIGFVKKICPYEKVIYLCAPLKEDEEIHHLTVGTCVFDFNPEESNIGNKNHCTSISSSLSPSTFGLSNSSMMATHHQPYFQYKSMTIDKGEILLNAHRVKLEQQMQQHYSSNKQ